MLESKPGTFRKISGQSFNIAPMISVVDDDLGIIDSLRDLLGPLGHEVRGYTSAQAFLNEFDIDRFGCIILDERMPGMSGHALHKELIRRGSITPIIVCTGYAEVDTAVEAMKSGAITVIRKPYHHQKMIDAVHEALRLDEVHRIRRARIREFEARRARLTPRQKEVLLRISRGKQNRTIAAEMGISERTVELHRSRVLKAMGVESVAELAFLLASLNSELSE